MKISKGIKRGSVFAIAVTVALSGFVLPKVYAAGIKTDAKCMVQIDLRNSGFQELTGQEALPVQIGLYKVADVDISGNYTARQVYENLDFSVIDADTTPEEWGILAEGVKEVIQAEALEETAAAVSEYGTAVVTDLETGLYLVDIGQVVSDDYVYDFNPFMVSLPNNYFYSTQDDTWVYDLVGEKAIIPKVERSQRFGDLIIHKLLDTYNETLGSTTFVFQVEAVKTDIDADPNAADRTKVVFSDVFSMTFDGTGTDSLTIKDLPAGSEVTVTEIYSGASYKVTTDAMQKVEIVGGESVITNFENTYDERLNGCSGIVNSFLYDSESDEWIPSQAEDSTP